MPIKNLNIRGAILTRSCTGLNRSLIKQLLISHDIFELYTRAVIESVITIRKEDSAPSPRSLFESHSSQFQTSYRFAVIFEAAHRFNWF